MNRMTKTRLFASVGVAAAVFGLLVSTPAGAADIRRCAVEADTFILHGHGPSYGYPDVTPVKSYSWVGADALFRFDLSEIESIDAIEHRIVSAEFNAYTGQCTGMMCHPMAPAGTTQQAQVLALRTWDPEVHPHGLTYWTEALRGDYENGHIDGTVESQSGLPNIYDPGDAGGVNPYAYQANGLNPGEPSVVMQHSGGPGVPVEWGGDPADLNPDGWAKVQLKEFVRRWTPEAHDHIANNGIRIHDLGGWSGSPDPEFPDDYDWGWCFCSKDYKTGTTGMYDPAFHLLPAGEYLPYLEVTIALEGDANADGKVDILDLNRLAANWGSTSANWSEGDFDHNSCVDILDLNKLAANWGHAPEPATMALLAVGGLALLRCRRRRSL